MPDTYTEREITQKKPVVIPNAGLKEILTILSTVSGVDFLQYKTSTILRWMQRRMSMMNIPGYEEYLSFVKEHEQEQQILFEDLLIHVSSFFRDESSFEYVVQVILPLVVQQARERAEPIRIWVAGCATGEEAYSIAICLYELIGDEHFASHVRIFATDLSDSVIMMARKGIYTKAQVTGISDERLERFFTVVEQGYEIAGVIRDVCVFATHNMLTDPPFAKLDLISCRNVLIYMQPVLQKKMLSIFNYALKDQGFLWLGKSETNRVPALFGIPSKKAKVYLKKSVEKWTLRNAFPTNKKIRHMVTNYDLNRQQHESPGEELPVCQSGWIENSDLRILQLERELQRYKEELRAVAEAYEATNEELQSANEELKSLNEELEVSQEELQAINEELSMRNNDLLERNSQVRNNEERLRMALDGTRTGTWEFHPLTKELLLSDRSRELFGIASSAPLKFSSFIRSIYPPDVPGVQIGIKSALAGKNHGQINLDFRISITDDKVSWISCKARAYFDEHNNATRVLGVVTDITESKQFERHLQDVNSRLNFALQTGRLGSWELDLSTGVLNCNEQCKSNFGLSSQADFTFEKLLSMTIPEDAVRVDQAVRAAVTNRTLYSEEYRIRWPDGTIHWIAATGQAIAEEKGIANRMIGVTLDITERKQAQLHLQQSEAYFRMIADTAPAMIWIAEKDGSFSFFNKAWQKYTGRTLEQNKNKGWYDIMHPEDTDKWKLSFSRSSRDRKNFYAEFRLKRNDGTYHWLACSGIPKFNSQDEFVGFIGACTDIDDQKMVEDALERKVRERTIALEEANVNLSKRNHELEQFVFITSHDLQEPLRKIRLFADMLESMRGDNATVDTALYLRKVKQSAIRMSDLIRDLIAYSRLELGENAFLPVDLNQIAANVIEDFELLIKDKNAVIEINDLPVIDAVPLQMNQLFYNLIGNALKFSGTHASTRITITTNKIAGPDMAAYPCLPNGPVYHKITVADNGIGFNQAYADKLFVIFQRLNQKEKFEGTGIGLALCRKIMDIHNGDIQAFGVEHQGASFHIIIPETQQ